MSSLFNECQKCHKQITGEVMLTYKQTNGKELEVCWNCYQMFLLKEKRELNGNTDVVPDGR